MREESYRFRNSYFIGSVMTETTNSYRCKVSLANSRAVLRLGWQSFRVDVVEMSRDTFYVRVPNRLASKIVVGRKSKLFYQEMLWSVLCTHKWIGDCDKVDLEFKQLDELTPIDVPKASFWAVSRQRSTHSDSNLPVTLIGMFILTILIMPAWGGQWGTSDAICNAVNSVYGAVNQLMSGRR